MEAELRRQGGSRDLVSGRPRHPGGRRSSEARVRERPSRRGDLRDHRRVVGGLLALSRVAVDPACGATLREPRRQQDVVDAQSVVLREREHALGA